MLDIMDSAVGGGIFGLVGTVLGRAATFFETKEKNKQEQLRWQHDLEATRLQADVDAARAEQSLVAAEVEGSFSGLQASIQADSSITGTSPLVTDLRAMTRPVLTILLWLITILIFFYSNEDARQTVVSSAVFASISATLWWFGDRSTERARSALKS
jgi:hypothetical protein